VSEYHEFKGESFKYPFTAPPLELKININL